jgi:hypothetical protein
VERLVQPWKLIFIFCTVAAALSAASLPSAAETANPYPVNGNTNSALDPNNVFNGTADTSSLFGLVNRLQLMNGRSYSDFASEQNEGFQSAVEEFRKKQQQQLQTPATGAPQKSAAPSRTP